MRSLTQDIVYALRLLRRQPVFAAVAVTTLALGIGTTTAVFTVVNGVLLRPLPYRDPDRILLLLNGRNGRLATSFSPPNFRDVSTRSGVFVESAAFDASNVNLTGQGDPQRLQARKSPAASSPCSVSWPATAGCFRTATSSPAARRWC